MTRKLKVKADWAPPRQPGRWAAPSSGIRAVRSWLPKGCSLAKPGGHPAVSGRGLAKRIRAALGAPPGLLRQPAGQVPGRDSGARPALASGEMSDPAGYHQAAHRPFFSPWLARLASTQGARSDLRLRQTTRTAPTDGSRCPQPPDHPERSRPRFRRRHPAVQDSAARPPAPPSAPAHFGRLPRSAAAPRRTLHAGTGLVLRSPA